MDDIVIVILGACMIFIAFMCLLHACLRPRKNIHEVEPEDIIYTTAEGNKRVEI